MTPFHLEIITQEKKALDEMVESVYVTTIDGDITVLANHTPYVSVLKPSGIIIRTNGDEKVLAGTGGIIEVTPGSAGSPSKVTILADSAVREDEIDEQKEEEVRERAEKLMEEKLSDREGAEAAAMLEKALLHINISRKRRHHRGKVI